MFNSPFDFERALVFVGIESLCWGTTFDGAQPQASAALFRREKAAEPTGERRPENTETKAREWSVTRKSLSGFHLEKPSATFRSARA